MVAQGSPFFDNTIGTLFFHLFNIRQNAPKNFNYVIMKYFIKKMLSNPILDLRKYLYKKMHESESACFLDWALPEVQNCI